jgi:rhodanese-related sulfurtransferase
LVAILQKPSPPLILQVGSHVLYAEAHIPKSEFIGSVNQPAGHDALAKRVSSLPRNAPIIIYCGCCPWERCPNIAAAFEQLHTMGFTSVKALYIAGNFGDDWVAKGYSVERGR